MLDAETTVDAVTPRVPRHTTATWIAVLLFALISMNYFRNAVTIAAGNSLWMDEVLAVWTAREPDIAAVWSALVHGSEFTPPLFDLLLHGLIWLGLDGPLVARAPSIVAMYLAAVAIGLLVRRRSGLPVALLAAAFLLVGPIFTYAVQARAYVAVTAAIAWAILVWDGLPATGRIGWRAGALGALLALAVGLHFYAIIPVAGFALAEAGLSLTMRRVRLPVWAAIMIGGGTILFWLPIMRAASVYVRADAFAPEYYGRPILPALYASYDTLFGVGRIMLPVFVAIAVLRLLRRRTPVFVARDDPKRLGATVLLTSAPCVVFLFAAVVTHSFAERYTLVGALGIAIFFSCLVDTLDDDAAAAAVTLLALLAAASFLPLPGPVASRSRATALQLVAGAPADLPIATGNGGRYLELMEALPHASTRRLIFLSAPPGGADPTNQHQAERWGAIRPTLVMRPASAFLREAPCFLWLVDSSELHDDLPSWMAKQPVRVRWYNTATVRLGMVETRPGTCHHLTAKLGARHIETNAASLDALSRAVQLLPAGFQPRSGV